MTSFRTRRWFWRLRAVVHRNPLLRPTTPTQRVVASATVLVVLAMAVGAVLLVLGTRSAMLAEARSDATNIHQVSATVLATEDPQVAELSQGATPADDTVDLSWTWRGQRHTGEETTMGTLASGSTTTTWVDNSGAIAPRPWTSADLTIAVLGIAIGAAVLLIIVAVAALRFMGAWNVRRRADSWATQWAVVAPRWSRDHGFR